MILTLLLLTFGTFTTGKADIQGETPSTSFFLNLVFLHSTRFIFGRGGGGGGGGEGGGGQL